jgi:hypothetical protein
LDLFNEQKRKPAFIVLKTVLIILTVLIIFARILQYKSNQN